MVVINFAGYNYSLPSNIINIFGVNFDLNKVEKFIDNESELARLYLDILPTPQRIIKDYSGQDIIISEKIGIDLSTATFIEIKNFLNDITIKKSDSVKSLCRRVMFLKFKTDFISEIPNVSSGLKKEYNMIALDKRKNVDFLGEVGFNYTVFFDRSKNS